MRILAFDPGGTTGIAFATGDSYISRGALGPKEHHIELASVLNHFAPNLVVCESFENRGLKAAPLISVEYIGLIKYFTTLHHIPLVFQSPSVGKGFWNDERLKKVNEYTTGTSSAHMNDATRHLLHFLSFDPKHKVRKWLDLLEP